LAAFGVSRSDNRRNEGRPMSETSAAGDEAPKREFAGFGAIVRDSLVRLVRLPRFDRPPASRRPGD
jgi:hypothetical protein